MGGSGRGGFLLVPQQRKGSLFLKALPFLETTCGILDASGGSVRSGGHVAHVSHSYLLAYCIPLHNFRYGISKGPIAAKLLVIDSSKSSKVSLNASILVWLCSTL